MIYGIFGDIHGNFDAFLAVVEALESEGVDKMMCIGDLVGYGPEPARCIEMVRELDCSVVAGNHDFGVAGKFPISGFNDIAYLSATWTRNQLSTEHLRYLRGLPVRLIEDNLTLVHGSLINSGMFNYIFSEKDARDNFEILKTPVLFYGHTHVPLAITIHNGEVKLDKSQVYDLCMYDKVLLNCGSVGQPRDNDKRAAYVIFDTERNIIEIKRVEYDKELVADKILKAGLPKKNASRLLE
jgi:diadenosine tetraphosphatase ApaH/serine/threonine PP2A family protein phosphatase